jgi:hypothetical protein
LLGLSQTAIGPPTPAQAPDRFFALAGNVPLNSQAVLFFVRRLIHLSLAKST